MQKSVPEKGFTLTGIPGLDAMLGGGIPTGHAVSIFGGPGAGKTTFSLQFLHNGATMYDEPGLYVLLMSQFVILRETLEPTVGILKS